MYVHYIYYYFVLHALRKIKKSQNVQFRSCQKKRLSLTVSSQTIF